MRRLLLPGLIAFLLAPLAHGTALSPFIDLQEQGLTLAGDGAGLATWPAGGVTLDVTTGGTVRFALLYWSGIDTACAQDGGGNCIVVQPFGDQEAAFNGNPLVGTLIGTEQQGAINHVGYFADVTAIVSAAGTGPHSFTFTDGNLANNLDIRSGVSLLIGYTNAADPAIYRVIIWDNLDFGLAAETTTPVTFGHGALSTTRPAELLIIAGEGEPAKNDSLVISNNPTVANSLDASSGIAWDHDVRTITIPAATPSTSVQLVSPAGDPSAEDFAWEVAALRVAIGDVTLPTCSSVTVAGPPKRFDITLQDTESGIAQILVTESTNADTIVPPFVVGTTDPVFVTSTKINQALPMTVGIRTTDVAGNVTFCELSDENEADLSITKSASTPSIVAGAPFTYTIVVTNQGPGTATGVVVTDPLPTGITATSSSSTAGTCSGTTTVTCNVGTLLNGASATITINAAGSPATTGVMTNTASVTAASSDSDPADNSDSADITVAADVSSIPALDARGLALLAMLIAAAAVLVMGR